MAGQIGERRPARGSEGDDGPMAVIGIPIPRVARSNAELVAQGEANQEDANKADEAFDEAQKGDGWG